MERVLVAGATSRVGRHLAGILAERGHPVRALCRDPSRMALDGVERCAGDVTRPASLEGACEAIDVVVSLVGASVRPGWEWPPATYDEVDHRGNLALLARAVAAGVRRFVYVSVFGDYPPGLRYVEAHRAAAEAVRASPLEAVVVRPTGYFSSLEVLLDLARWPVATLPGGGRARSNPIADADLAEILADAVTGPAGDRDVGGPEVLTRREMTEAAFRVRGRTSRLIPVPVAPVRWLGAVLGLVHPRMGDLVRFLAHAVSHDLVAPARGSRRLAEHFSARMRHRESGAG